MTLLARLAASRAWKLVAIAYVVKAVLVGGAWLLIPDLRERTTQLVRQVLSMPAEPAR
jgi:hypothetical protein